MEPGVLRLTALLFCARVARDVEATVQVEATLIATGLRSRKPVHARTDRLWTWRSPPRSSPSSSTTS
jgi:hypothetical protein